MKKRWIALMMATCMAMAPVSCFAEDETDYSYLEDMSVKELKELRDAINEILGEDSGSSSNNGEVPEEVLNNAKTIYDNLVNASEISLDALTDVYSAWHYGVYTNERNAHWNTFCGSLNISSDDIKKGIKEYDSYYNYCASKDADPDVRKYTNNMDDFFRLLGYNDNFMSYCVNYIVYAYMVTENGFTVIETCLNDAKSALKNIAEECPDYKYYSDLKDFYTEVDSLYEFVSNPTGTFESLGNTKTDFESSIKKYTTDLGLLFEE